mgnify:FL=1
MAAELIDIFGDFELGNKFTLHTAAHLASKLDDSFRVIVKYQGQDMPTYNDNKHNVVFCTSKEIHIPPKEFARDDVLIIFQHYFMLDRWGYPVHNPLSYPLPLGTFKDPDPSLEIKPLPEREYDFCFMGQIPHTGTRDAFKRGLDRVMNESGDKYKYFVKITNGFNKGLDRDEYFDVLNNSKLCLCPQGAHSPETFRLFEALSVGAIPIVDKLPKLWYYERCPFLNVDRSWYTLDDTLVENLNFLQTSNCRQMLYSLADYCQTVLNPAALAGMLEEKVHHRLATKDSNREILQEIRKGIIHYEDMGTIKL